MASVASIGPFPSKGWPAESTSGLRPGEVDLTGAKVGGRPCGKCPAEVDPRSRDVAAASDKPCKRRRLGQRRPCDFPPNAASGRCARRRPKSKRASVAPGGGKSGRPVGRRMSGAAGPLSRDGDAPLFRAGNRRRTRRSAHLGRERQRGLSRAPPSNRTQRPIDRSGEHGQVNRPSARCRPQEILTSPVRRRRPPRRPGSGSSARGAPPVAGDATGAERCLAATSSVRCSPSGAGRCGGRGRPVWTARQGSRGGSRPVRSTGVLCCRQGVVEHVAGHAAAVGQRADGKAAPRLGQRRQHVLGLLLAAQPTPAPNSPGGEGGEADGNRVTSLPCRERRTHHCHDRATTSATTSSFRARSGGGGRRRGRAARRGAAAPEKQGAASAGPAGGRREGWMRSWGTPPNETVRQTGDGRRQNTTTPAPRRAAICYDVLYFSTTQTHQQLVTRRNPERGDGRTARFKRILVARVGEVRSDDD